MTTPLRVLIVEDSDDDAKLVSRTPRRDGTEVTSIRVDTPDAMQAALQKHTWDAVLSDYAMPHGGQITIFGIVKQGAGHLAGESRPGAGATIRISFPEATGSSVETNNHQPTVAEVASRGNEVLLLAEDDLGVRALVNQILGRNGCTVLEGKNGKEALHLEKKYSAPIHALVTDVVLPEMGGFDLAQQLRLIHPETKVLFVSGYPDPPNLRNEMQKDDVAFRPKPLSPSGLTGKVREALDSLQPSPNRPSERK